MAQNIQIMLVVKKISFIVLAVAAITAFSCNRIGEADGEQSGQIRISFSNAQEFTKATGSLPDTSDFLLTVKHSGGSVIYDGTVANSPEAITVDPGSYTITAISEAFTKPAFDRPQWGDEQCIVVGKGEIVNVKLVCRLTNAGVRLKISSGFLTKYPDGVLRLQSSQGNLTYGYSEKRIAYFPPGNVSLVLNENTNNTVIASRTLEAQEILTLKINAGTASESSGGMISVAVDTTKNWVNENIDLEGGGEDKGSEIADALSVNQAQSSVGAEGVWVCGHIVGGDCSQTNASFTTPFDSDTHILIASRASTKDKSSCICVSLPKGKIRDALNLVSHPENLGKKVYIKGDIVESYYGVTGLKNPKDYSF